MYLYTNIKMSIPKFRALILVQTFLSQATATLILLARYMCLSVGQHDFNIGTILKQMP